MGTAILLCYRAIHWLAVLLASLLHRLAVVDLRHRLRATRQERGRAATAVLSVQLASRRSTPSFPGFP